MRDITVTTADPLDRRTGKVVHFFERSVSATTFIPIQPVIFAVVAWQNGKVTTQAIESLTVIKVK